MKRTIISFLLLSFALNVQGQFLKRVMKGAKDKVVNKVEDRLIDELTNELARQMYKPIDKALDSLLYREYESSPERDSIDYTGFLARLNSNVNLPPSYTFDVVLNVEVKDYDKQKHKMEMYFTKKGDFFAFKQLEGKKDDYQFMVVDYENDLMAMYSEKDGKKTVQAIPSMMGFASSMAKHHVDSKEYQLEETGKEKKIAGYTCKEYKMKTEEEENTIYAAEEFPITWKESFGAQLSEFSSESYAKSASMIKGMILQTESILLKDDKKKSSWKTKKVNTKGYVLDNNEYEKRALIED